MEFIGNSRASSQMLPVISQLHKQLFQLNQFGASIFETLSLHFIQEIKNCTLHIARQRVETLKWVDRERKRDKLDEWTKIVHCENARTSTPNLMALSTEWAAVGGSDSNDGATTC